MSRVNLDRYFHIAPDGTKEFYSPADNVLIREAVAFDYPEHIGAPTRESSICRAYAYSRLLRGAPTVKKVLHIVYEHCV